MSGPTKAVKTKLFIGNLDPGTQPGIATIKDTNFLKNNFVDLDELSELFAAYGTVLEASVIKDYGFIVSIEIRE